MNEVVIVLLIANMLLLVWVAVSRKGGKDDTSATLIKQDITELHRSVDKLTSSLHEQVADRLEKSSALMQQSVTAQLKESSKLVADVSNRLTKLDETNKRVVDVADELKTLQNVLSNPKQRGILGEYYLQTVLENVMPPDRYKLQYKFSDGQIVDAVIILDKGKILPIDSKFSLENYNRLVEETDKHKRELLIASFKTDLKNRIDETSKYIRPSENTMDFAFMFIPSEAIYYDLLINKIGAANTSARDLLEYAFRDKNVIIVSPTSFMAYLQTVMQGLRSLQIEEQAKEIQKRVGELGRHLNSYQDFTKRMGASLSTTVNHFNSSQKELGKIDKDVTRIAGASPGIEPLLIDKPADELD